MINNNCNTSIGIVDSDMAKRGVGQPKKEPTKAPAPQATGTVQMASKEHDMTKQINEASMNISMNGADAKEVADLIAILKNAGMDSSRIDMPMAHMHHIASWPLGPLHSKPHRCNGRVLEHTTCV